MSCHSQIQSTRSAVLLTATTLLGFTVACRTVNHSSQSTIDADVSSIDGGGKGAYHVIQYEGSSAYTSNPEKGKCQLFIYTSKKENKVLAVKFKGLTRDFEVTTYKVGGPAEDNKDRIDLKTDLERADYKDIAFPGYIRIARSEETERGPALLSKTLIVVDIAVHGEQDGYFGTVVGTEVYKTKMIGGITTDDTSRQRKTLSCDGVKKVAESDTSDLPKH